MPVSISMFWPSGAVMGVVGWFFTLFRLPPTSTLFPYTTLFRSRIDPCRSHRVTEAEESFRLEEELRRSEEHTSELQSQFHLVCRLLLEKKKSPASWQARQVVTPSRQSCCTNTRMPGSASM